jgi:hypothetical protein
MKRNAEGRVDLSLGGLIPAQTKPSTSQPAATSPVQANREVEMNRAVVAPTVNVDQVAARFEGLDPFTRSLIEQNPLVPQIQPRAEKARAQAVKPGVKPKPQAATGEPKGGSLDGLFMMLGAALATSAGGLALAKAKPGQPQPTLSRVPVAQPALASPAPAFHIPTR